MEKIFQIPKDEVAKLLFPLLLRDSVAGIFETSSEKSEMTDVRSPNCSSLIKLCFVSCFLFQRFRNLSGNFLFKGQNPKTYLTNGTKYKHLLR